MNHDEPFMNRSSYFYFFDLDSMKLMPNEWLYHESVHDYAGSTFLVPKERKMKLLYKPESESEKSDQIQIDKFKYFKNKV